MSGKRYAVIGLGQFGTAIATMLSERGADVLAIDNNENHVQNIRDDVAYAVLMEATDKKALVAQGVPDMDAVVVAIGKDFESLLLCTAYLLELKVKRVIARATGAHQRMILEKMGVQEILSPEGEVGKLVAERLLNPDILSFLQLPDDYEIVEVKAPNGIVGRTLYDIDLRNKYKLNLVTMKREYLEEEGGEEVKKQHVLGVPSSKTEIQETDTVVVFGRIKDIERFCEINR